MNSRIKKYLIITAAVLFALAALRLFLYRETLWVGLLLVFTALIAFLVWKAFIKNGHEDLVRSERRSKALEDEVRELKGQIAGLNRELEEKGKSRINVVELSPILHLAVMNIDTSFVRTYIREDAKAGLTFNGALRANICAEYGIKLEEVGFRYDAASDTLYLADFHPGLISFSKKQLNWEIATAFASRPILSRLFSSGSLPSAKAYREKMCKELRDDLEKEIDERKIAEFEWLSPMVSQQVTDMMKVLIGHPGMKIVTFEGRPEGEYLSFPEFRKQFSPAVGVQQIEDNQ